MHELNKLGLGKQQALCERVSERETWVNVNTKWLVRDNTWAWRYVNPETISRMYFLAVSSPMAHCRPEPSQTHLPSTYSSTVQVNISS